MEKLILVTYASRTGSTVGVAEAIGETLMKGGAQVEVRAMEITDNLNPYDAVVAGSAIRSNCWLPEAMQFLRDHREALRSKPFAAFLVCMTLAIGNGRYRQQVESFLDPVRALVRPVAEGYFAGVLDIRKVPSLRDRVLFRVSVALGVWSQGNHWDWDAIHAWAESLPTLLLAHNA